MADTWHGVGTIIASIRKTSGLFPLLVLDLVLAVLTSLSFATGNEGLIYFLAGITAFSVVATVVAYFIFMFKDPSMLRSEVHVRQMRAMDILGDNLHGAAVPADIIAIANPARPIREADALELPEGTDKQPNEEPPRLV